MFNKNKASENSGWKSYTDLVTGLLMVFILISIVAFNNYNDMIGKTEATEKQYEMIKKIDSTFRHMKSDKLFVYDTLYNQFKLGIDVEFDGNGEWKTNIKDIYKSSLDSAGTELSTVLKELNEKFNVKFTIIIEGRAAKYLRYFDMKRNEELNKRYWEKAMKISYDRAYQLKKLWWESGVFTWEDNGYIDLTIAGAGFSGNGRYPYRGEYEGKNKNFIVKVIPRFSPDFFDVENK